MDNGDVLAAVLQRLAPRSLAVSRCVCRAWRSTIDARRMLRGDLLPVSLGGIFVSLGHEPAPPEFFARPSTGPRIAARLHDYVEAEDWPIFMNQCCNGLLLLEGCVVNPATRRCVRLPPCPPDASRLDARFGWRQEYLAFDPTVSPHYQVLLIHAYLDGKALEGSQSEWPPSPYSIPVYSSRTGAWEARPFVREGAAAGTVAGVRSATEPLFRHAVCRHEALYLHCKGDFVMRIALSDNKYQVIKLPAGIEASVYDQMYLGKSEKGVYCAVVENQDYRLQVLFLDESGGRMEWVFKYDINLAPLVVHLSRNPHSRIDRPWTLQDNGQGVKVQEEDLQWDSDDDNVLDIEDG